MFSFKPQISQNIRDDIETATKILKNRLKFDENEFEITECQKCCTPLESSSTHLVCKNCGMQSEQLVIEDVIDFSVATVSQLSYKDSNYSNMLNNIYNKLRKFNTDTHMISCEIFRKVANRYVGICKLMRQSQSANGSQIRCASILPALLWDELASKISTFKTEQFICEFMNITKKKMSHSKSKFYESYENGFSEMKMIEFSKIIPLIIDKYLDDLEISNDYTNVIVEILNLCNDPKIVVNHRTCNDTTKYVGIIWLITNQIGITIQHEKICEKTDVSKSTYERYVDFLYDNRKIINPILVKHRIRPIPRSFCIKKQGRRKKVLNPITDDKFIWFPIKLEA